MPSMNKIDGKYITDLIKYYMYQGYISVHSSWTVGNIKIMVHDISDQPSRDMPKISRLLYCVSSPSHIMVSLEDTIEYEHRVYMAIIIACSSEINSVCKGMLMNTTVISMETFINAVSKDKSTLKKLTDANLLRAVDNWKELERLKRRSDIKNALSVLVDDMVKEDTDPVVELNDAVSTIMAEVIQNTHD